MEEAFVIMRIGDKALDELWKNVYIPAIKECGLDPKRVDKHNEGRLLASEIADFIKRAKIIIADLTAERPNCYLEVGYAMGINKFTNLILCAKQGEKVHFDLSGYDTLRWDSNDLKSFKLELIKKIKYRLEKLDNLPDQVDEDNEIITNWITKERSKAIEKFTKASEGDGCLEVIFLPQNIKINKEIDELKQIAKDSKLDYVTWPIGFFLENQYRPKVVLDGIRAIYNDPNSRFGKLFDYWMLRKDGHFYFLRNFDSEIRDDRRVLYFDIRIRRITEIFLYCGMLYTKIGLDAKESIKILINHRGLKGRILTSKDHAKELYDDYECEENDVSIEFKNTLNNIIGNIRYNVFEIAKSLFLYFDAFHINKIAADQIVDDFLNKRT